jgi:hypothetical protein
MIEKDAHELKHTSAEYPYQMSGELNKDKTFKLIWIQSIKTSSPENVYKILFRDIDKGFYLQQRVFPEQLAVCTLGSYFKDSKLLTEIPPDGRIFEIDVESKKSNTIVKISHVLDDNEYNLTHHYEGKNKSIIDYTDENKRQFCVVLENERQKVIFPCPVIGTAYYFISKSMREHIFFQNLQSLFYTADIDKKTRKAVIKLKPGAANNDAAHIMRFCKNELARRKWHAIRNSLRSTSSAEAQTFAPIIIDFPVEQALHMTVRGLAFQDQKTGKEKILVLDILREDSSFDFDDIEIIRDENERPSSEGKKNPVAKVKSFKTTNTLEIKVPASNLSTAAITAFVGPRNTNIPNMKVTRRYIKGKKGTVVRTEEGWEFVDVSLLPPDASGDKGVRPGDIVREPEEREPKEAKDAFTLNDFREMVEYLKNNPDVHNFMVNGPSLIPSRVENPDTDYLYSFREVYDKETNEIRQYMSVGFTYKDYYVCAIEIDQPNLSNGCASYVLTAEGNHDFNWDITDLLKAYVQYKKVKDIRKKIEGKKMRFFSKYHPIAKIEQYYKSWCDELLWRIDQLGNA